MKILITDSFSRKSFDVYNIIKNSFSKEQIILTSDGGRVPSQIIYFKNIQQLRNSSFEIFCQDLLKISNSFLNEEIIFIPVNEDKISLFYQFIEKYGVLNFKYSLPSKDDFFISKNKYLLNDFCLKNNIPSPLLFKNINEITQDGFIPIIAKPREGSGSVGINIINNYNEISALSNVDTQKYVVQELLPNGKDVRAGFFLCKNGETINSYSHERIRTYPMTGGVSVFSRIIENKEIEIIAEDIIKKLNWSGLLMIEFLYDHRDKKYKLIEINPRLWGSIMLSEFSGSELLSNYINLSLNKEPICTSINSNKKIRWLVFDLINFIKLKGKIKDFWKISKRDTCYINITYGKLWSILFFHFFFYLDPKNFLRFLKK